MVRISVVFGCAVEGRLLRPGTVTLETLDPASLELEHVLNVTLY
jgi:hypothetical protein